MLKKYIKILSIALGLHYISSVVILLSKTDLLYTVCKELNVDCS